MSVNFEEFATGLNLSIGHLGIWALNIWVLGISVMQILAFVFGIWRIGHLCIGNWYIEHFVTKVRWREH